MTARSLLDGFGTDSWDRVVGLVWLAAEMEPDDLEPELRWVPPAGRAQVIAHACVDEPETLSRAVDFVAGLVDRGVTVVKGENGRLGVSMARGLVILRAAERALHRGEA